MGGVAISKGRAISDKAFLNIRKAFLFKGQSLINMLSGEPYRVRCGVLTRLRRSLKQACLKCRSVYSLTDRQYVIHLYLVIVFQILIMRRTLILKERVMSHALSWPVLLPCRIIVLTGAYSPSSPVPSRICWGAKGKALLFRELGPGAAAVPGRC